MSRFIFIFLFILVIGVIATVFTFKDNLTNKIPIRAEEYSVATLSCSYQEKICSQISFDFIPSEESLKKIPEYSIQEFFNRAKTEIIFKNVNSIKDQFNYNEIINDPLIEAINYYQKDNNFVVEIKRNGAFLPTEVNLNGSVATIILKEGDENYPKISDQKPADDSIAYPALRKIRFRAILKDPLKRAIILFQDSPVEFSIIETSSNQYLFEFVGNIVKDEQYKVTAIITDNQNRTTVSNWEFEGQTPSETVLGSDRFKYLGWWGELNADGVSVREKPTRLSKQLGTFSSINRVKILKEISGENINENNVWYEIDGGKYPHAYVFSEYITPMAQPEPPQNFTIPKEVKDGEYWIDVNLTKKIITLFLYDKAVFSSYVAIGKEENPTITGTFNVWYKVEKARMKGGPPLHSYQYDLPDVPNVLYYEGSYAIHGTYWHDKFSTQQSAGCTNLTQGDAVFIFDKVNPKLEPEQEYVFSSKDNPGTIVNNHQ